MRLLRNEVDYDYFLQSRFISGAFLQSSLWRNFLKKQKKTYWQTVVFKDDELAALCLFYQNELPFDFSYLYAPKGPVVAYNLSPEERKEALALILSSARDVSVETKKKKELFFKFEPSDQFLLQDDFTKENDVQPKETWVIDLNKNEDELLAAMHAKTRYNINLARKKGVKIRFSRQEKDFDSFYFLIKETSRRNNIISHSRQYYQLLYQVILEHQAGHLAIAELAGQVLAANLVINFSPAATYLHGGADYKQRQLMAPHLLQWESIKKAKIEGLHFYDFWGIAPEDGSKPSWQGISRFKKSFGGRSLVYPGAYNLIYNQNWYNLYDLSKRFRRCFKKLIN
ncbi:MAG: peptidoglycan bridge formation glycyltransferase FemA/FemB family protein [Patescibacteria group bacterium]|nr:peptidoglycan bridge formation glycyltransferase FemA/FemB family protein [Patescibacteria group bacterium]